MAASRRALIVLALAASALVIATPAQGAFPGGNGKIAFATGRDGTGNDEIYTMNADGTNQTRLTNNPAFDEDPAWSPDGTKIAFNSDRDGNGYEIYTMNADGTNQTRLTNNAAHDFYPTWSPDGTKIAFDRRGGIETMNGIYTMNADVTNQTLLASGGYPAWSPGGTKIAFVAGDNGISTMNADGTNQTPLTTVAGDEFPTWSPDGTKIAFTSYRVLAGNRAVWQLGQVHVFDGGTDGVASTAGDSTLFMTQGLLVP